MRGIDEVCYTFDLKETKKKKKNHGNSHFEDGSGHEFDVLVVYTVTHRIAPLIDRLWSRVDMSRKGDLSHVRADLWECVCSRGVNAAEECARTTPAFFVSHCQTAEARDSNFQGHSTHHPITNLEFS